MNAQNYLIWIVEDKKDYADTLAFILNNTSGLTLSKHFFSVEELESFLQSPSYTKVPDLVLLDINLEGGKSGVDGVQDIKKVLQNVPVLMLTFYSSKEKIIEALRAGAEGYIVKGTPHDELIRAIKDAIAGKTLLLPQVKKHILGHFQKRKNIPDYRLTEKQMAVLCLMCDGLGRAQIAEEMGIKHPTVDNHYRQIYDKLGVHSEAAAVAKALKEGIVPLH